MVKDSESRRSRRKQAAKKSNRKSKAATKGAPRKGVRRKSAAKGRKPTATSGDTPRPTAASPTARSATTRGAAAAAAAAEEALPPKVTRLAPGPAAHAEFARELQRAAVLLIVRGDSADSRLAVARGAQLAGTATRPRWVVWAPQPAAIAADLAGLANATDGEPNATLLLSLSLDREIRFILPSDQSPSEGRVFKAFTRAEV